MNFNINEWRQQAIDNLNQLKQQWLVTGDPSYIAYGTIAGMSLWPLVEAAMQKGQWEAVLIALYGVASGVGGNLIAEQLQRWRDRSETGEKVTESHIVDWSSQKGLQDADLHQAIDDVVAELDSLIHLQYGLPEDKWRDLAAELRGQLERLGTIGRFAPIINSTVATGNAVAVAGDVNAPIMTGSTATLTYIANQQIVQSSTYEQANLPPKLRAYLFQLYQLLLRYFNQNEIRDLCFETNVEYDDLPGEGRIAKARELIFYLDRQQRITDFINTVRRYRPSVTWPVYYPIDDSRKSPFKGLQFFDENDAPLFFGREQSVANIVNRLQEHRFLVVVGASGSGKSSIIRAGVIPAIRQGKQTSNYSVSREYDKRWTIITLTPTSDPFGKLALAITRDMPTVYETKTIEKELNAHPGNLYVYLRKLLDRQQKSHLLLIVDQFEELFAVCKDELARRNYINTLLHTTTLENIGVNVIIVLRADFYAQIAQYDILREALMTRQILVGSMNRNELRQAIEEPAKKMGSTFQDGLVEQLLRDVGAGENRDPEPGALPLLSHALLETWRRRSGNSLTLFGYLATGGVQGAIAETAESTYQSLNKLQKKIARNIFLRLTELGEGTEDTSRKVALHELISTDETESDGQHILNILTQERLITTSDGYVEVAHEALIREWPRLQNWLNDDREGLRLHWKLRDAALDWDKHDRNYSYLYEGARLSVLEEWLPLAKQPLSELEKAFVDASIRRREQAITKEREIQKSQLDSERRRAEAEHMRAEEQSRRVKTLRRAFVIISLLSILAVGAAVYGILQRDTAIAEGNARATQEAIAINTANLATTREAEALHQATIAQSQSLAIASQSVRNSNAMTALLLAIEAGQKQETPLAYEAIWGVAPVVKRPSFILDHDACISSAVWNVAGDAILSASYDGTSRIWDANSGKSLLLLSHNGSVIHSKWNSNEQRILTNDTAGEATIWDANTGEKIRTFHHNEEVIYEANWNYDETLLLTVSGPKLRDNGRVVIWGYTLMINVWDVATGELLFSLPAENSRDLIALWEKGGNKLLTYTGSDEASVWNGETWELTYTLPHGSTISEIVFSGDENIVTAGDGQAKVWNSENGDLLYTLSHGALISALKVSDDGNFVVTGGINGIAKIWNIKSGELLHDLFHGDIISTLVFNEDSNLIITIGENGVANIWNSETGELVHTLSHTAQISSVNLSKDGSQIVTGDVVGRVKLWNLETSELLAELFHEGKILELELNRAGNQILSTSGDPIGTSCTSTTKVWDSIPESMYVTINHEEELTRAEWNRDESRILTLDSNGNTGVWDADTGVLLSSVPSTGKVAFNGDGSRAIVYDMNGRAAIIDIQNDKLLYSLQHDGEVSSAIWNTNSSQILTASKDETVRIWDATSGLLLLSFTHGWFVSGASWNTNEDSIMAYDELGFVNIWDASTGKLLVSFSRNEEVRGDPIRVYAAKWNATGDRIVTTEETSTVKVWDALSGELMWDLVNAGVQANWDTTGRYLLTCCRVSSISGYEDAKVWNAETGELVFSLPHDYPIRSAIWNEDSSRILTITHDGAAHIWNAEDGKPIFNIIIQGDSISAAAWNKAADLLLITTDNGVVHIYPTQLPDLLEAACRFVTRNLTWEDWQLYLPGQLYKPTCPALPCDPSVPPHQLAPDVCQQ